MKVDRNNGEIVFGSSEASQSMAIKKAIKAGTLRKIAPKVYSTNLIDSPEIIIRKNIYHIINQLFPGAIISHRSALEGRPSDQGLIVLSYKYSKKIELPGITIRLIAGPTHQIGDTAFLGNLYIASRARMVLENLTPSRGPLFSTVSLKTLEDYLDKLCLTYGEENLNQLRDEAKRIAKPLKLTKEFEKLDKIIGALLGSRTNQALNSNSAKARAKGKPYDTNRITLFSQLALALKQAILPNRSLTVTQLNTQKYLPFFEAYFSNYIEGTKFLVTEAYDIIYHHKIVNTRVADTHDIMNTFLLVTNQQEMNKTPKTVEEFLRILQHRHKQLMSGRTECQPGKFKHVENRAGNTIFVKPELVIGTLEQAFDFYLLLEPGIMRAIFMMFLITEIHPFLDGNGRIARIMMNAELVANNNTRIIIPTVYRDDYLLTLRRLSREYDPTAFIQMLIRAQDFVGHIDFSNYQDAIKQLESSNAFKDSNEGILLF